MEAATIALRERNVGQERTQRLRALEKANEVRTRRARFKKDVKAGRASVHEVLTTVPDWVETMKIWDLVLCQPKLGRVKASRLLNHHRVTPGRQVGGLTTRQRAELAVAIGR